MNEYEINDEYGYSNYEYLHSVIERTLKEENVKNACFSIIFVGNEKIQELNRVYRGKDAITDVISFALEDNEAMQGVVRVLGDIYVCIPRMKEQAVSFSHSEKRELSFLVVHGLLHLLGYDHVKSKEEEKIMFDKQDKILEQENIID